MPGNVSFKCENIRQFLLTIDEAMKLIQTGERPDVLTEAPDLEKVKQEILLLGALLGVINYIYKLGFKRGELSFCGTLGLAASVARIAQSKLPEFMNKPLLVVKARGWIGYATYFPYFHSFFKIPNEVIKEVDVFCRLSGNIEEIAEIIQDGAKCVQEVLEIASTAYVG